MKRAWAYFRCSTGQQERSIPDQKKAMESIIAEQGIQIVETFEDEGVSGVDPVAKRPEFSRMQHMANVGTHKEQDVSCILCYDISRWGRFRDPADSIFHVQNFKHCGLPVYFTSDKLVPFEADGREIATLLMTTLGAAQATSYSEERSKLTTRGMRSTAQSGYWPGAAAPYGMSRVLLDEQGHPGRVMAKGEQKAIKGRRVTLCPGLPEQVKAVQMIFDLRANGWGYWRIAQHLNDQAIPPPKAKQWGPSSLLRIVRNPAYIGNLVFSQRDTSKFNDLGGKWINKPESEWIVKSGAWEGIIDLDTWNRAQETLGGDSNRFCRNAEYALSGVIKCARCDWSYYGHTMTKKGSQYYYYTHRVEPRRIDGSDRCKAYSLSRDLIEGFVVDEVRKALLQSDAESQVADYIRRCTDVVTDGSEEKLEDINHLLEDIDCRENNAREAMEKGVDPSFVAQSLERLAEERQELEDRKAGLDRSSRKIDLSSIDVEGLCASLGDYLADLEETLKVGGPDRRQDVLRSVVDRVVVDRPGNTATAYIRRIPEASGLPSFTNNVDNAHPLSTVMLNDWRWEI